MSWKNGDILRSLRRFHSVLTNDVTYHHIEAHQDEVLAWDELSVEAQLNCIVDGLAKKAIEKYLQQSEGYETTSRLPFESVAIYVGGSKIFGDICPEVRFSAGIVRAREFFHSSWCMQKTAFDQVDWEALNRTLSKKPKMFQL